MKYYKLIRSTDMNDGTYDISIIKKSSNKEELEMIKKDLEAWRSELQREFTSYYIVEDKEEIK